MWMLRTRAISEMPDELRLSKFPSREPQEGCDQPAKYPTESP
jgi:hypothetical protein